MLCSRYEIVREQAELWLEKLTRQFPHLHWSPRTIKTINNLLCVTNFFSIKKSFLFSVNQVFDGKKYDSKSNHFFFFMSRIQQRKFLKTLTRRSPAALDEVFEKLLAKPSSGSLPTLKHAERINSKIQHNLPFCT